MAIKKPNKGPITMKPSTVVSKINMRDVNGCRWEIPVNSDISNKRVIFVVANNGVLTKISNWYRSVTLNWASFRSYWHPWKM